MLNRQTLTLVAAFLCLSFLAGCGGGGGGSSVAQLTYNTDWTKHASSPGGQSQRLLIYDQGGTLAHAALIVDQNSTGVQSTPIAGLTAGTYHLHVDLYSGRDLIGSITGTYDATVNVQGATVVATVVGVPATGIKVVPAGATITSQQTLQFEAGGSVSASQGAFIVPGDLNWTTSNASIGAIDANSGLYTAKANSGGTGVVTARVGSSSLKGTGTISVTKVTTTTTKWTILVYMDAANDLYSFSDPNIVQMQQAAGNPQVRIVVQWKQVQSLFPGSSFDGTRRYLITSSSGSTVASQLVQNLGQGVDMGSPQTLSDFIAWAKTNYPATRTCLVMWDHGNGWKRGFTQKMATRGVSYDDEFSSAIETWQLQQAFGAKLFDIVAWDASLMQMIEVAYEIKSKASYVVGSEESPPGSGYPYNTILAAFRDNPDAPTATLCKAFVDGMLNAYGSLASENITQSVIDTSKLTALGASVSGLANALVAEQTHLQTIVPAVRAASQSYSLNASFGRYFYDLYDVSQRLKADSGLPDVATAAGAVLAGVNAAVVYERHNDNSPGSHGIAIDFSPGHGNGTGSLGFDSYAGDYALMQFGINTTWSSWLSAAP